MQLTSRFKIKDEKNIISFLNESHVGRLATIDVNGFPQIIPMNFVHLLTLSKNYDLNTEYYISKSNYENKNEKHYNNYSTDHSTSSTTKHVIYMHTHHKGEKISNIIRNPKVGFEVDKEICFLPSYYFHPTDASFADTLYISVVIKGEAVIVTNNLEKSIAMNCMMKKYQDEGKYTELTAETKSILHLTVIKINIETMDGKYKIGQQWPLSYRKHIANKIIEREGLTRAREILKDMKITILPDGELKPIEHIEM